MAMPQRVAVAGRMEKLRAARLLCNLLWGPLVSKVVRLSNDLMRM